VAQQKKSDAPDQTVDETQPNAPAVVRQSCLGASGEVVRNAVDYEDMLDRLSKGINIVGPRRGV
jgi:hypothetical protein